MVAVTNDNRTRRLRCWRCVRLTVEEGEESSRARGTKISISSTTIAAGRQWAKHFCRVGGRIEIFHTHNSCLERVWREYTKVIVFTWIRKENTQNIYQDRDFKEHTEKNFQGWGEGGEAEQATKLSPTGFPFQGQFSPIFGLLVIVIVILHRVRSFTHYCLCTILL